DSVAAPVEALFADESPWTGFEQPWTAKTDATRATVRSTSERRNAETDFNTQILLGSWLAC
ncbi:MAG: hypothetical protein Q8K99_08290, partial [Actinomycetota bacterium]|nr:hypothetical protein [Actinomycetota bacterium]